MYSLNLLLDYKDNTWFIIFMYKNLINLIFITNFACPIAFLYF